MITLNLELFSSKNSMKIIRLRNGRQLVVKHDRARKQEKEFKELLDANKEEWDRMTKGKEYPLKVQFFVYRKTKRIWDWLNIIQGLADAMTKAGYWPDDNTNYFTPVFKGWAVDKDNPRTEIEVL